MVQKIQYSDNLKEGTDKLNQSIDQSNTAFTQAQQAQVISEAAKILAESVQEQFNQVVIEGDSSVEAAQARVDNKGISHNSLKSRIDKAENKVDENVKVLSNGLLVLPSDFPKLPFNVYKKSKNRFTSDASPTNQHDWSTATEVYIHGYTTNGQPVDGKDPTKPITLSQFIVRYREGVYGSQQNFILTIITNIMSISLDEYLYTIPANFRIRSGSESKHTWVGAIRRRDANGITEPWHASDGIYKTVVPTNNSVDYPVNPRRLDVFGLPHPYKQVESLMECQNNVGSYYLDTVNDRNIYLNPYEDEDVNDVQVARRLPIFRLSAIGNFTVIFEDITFLDAGTSGPFGGTSLESKFYFFNCKFFRGLQDAFAVTGVYKVYLFNCNAAHGSKDAFNYHTTNENSVAVEINCRGFGSGKFKLIGGNTTTGSNNGSTAHDGMHMLRAGCEYWECEGPVVADIENCYSISIGCSSYDILDSTTGLRSGFYVHCDELNPLTEKPKYIIECTVSGKHFSNGIRAVNSDKTFYQGFTGNDELRGNPTRIEWEDVVNG